MQWIDRYIAAGEVWDVSPQLLCLRAIWIDGKPTYGPYLPFDWKPTYGPSLPGDWGEKKDVARFCFGALALLMAVSFGFRPAAPSVSKAQSQPKQDAFSVSRSRTSRNCRPLRFHGGWDRERAALGRMSGLWGTTRTLRRGLRSARRVTPFAPAKVWPRLPFWANVLCFRATPRVRRSGQASARCREEASDETRGPQRRRAKRTPFDNPRGGSTTNTSLFVRARVFSGHEVQTLISQVRAVFYNSCSARLRGICTNENHPSCSHFHE